jgi:hypothetical protein
VYPRTCGAAASKTAAAKRLTRRYNPAQRAVGHFFKLAAAMLLLPLIVFFAIVGRAAIAARIRTQ